MPFIAIAALIALCLGGGVTVAADHAKPGDALYSYKTEVNDNARAAYHSVKESLHLEAKTDVEGSASGDTHLSGDESANDDAPAGGPSHGLMIRTDGEGSSTVPSNVNADGSVHVNIY